MLKEGPITSPTMLSPRPSSILSHLAYRTVEYAPQLFAPAIAKTFRVRPTHYVLPDLPDVITDKHRNCFFHETPSSSRIVTIASSLHATTASLLEAARHGMKASGDGSILLVVGGNSKTSSSIPTWEAIKSIRTKIADASVWCVWDPNASVREETAALKRKIEAGATGILTQPILTARGWTSLEDAYSDFLASAGEVALVPGLALPTSRKSLNFWCELLKDPLAVRDDSMFREHLDYFGTDLENSSKAKDRQRAWANNELNRLTSYTCVGGVHFMPLGNVSDLAYFLE